MALVRVTTTISLDGYMAGPGGDMDWVFEYASDTPADAVDEMIETTGAILAGRGSYNVGRGSTRTETSAPFGGRWSGPQLVLTHDLRTTRRTRRSRSSRATSARRSPPRSPRPTA
jgi:hypothetical protein